MRSVRVQAIAALLGAGIVATSGLGAVSAQAADVSSLGYDPLTDGGSMSMVTQIVGAQDMWAKGYTGKGIDVAVIDTGVTRVPGLDRAGNVIDGPDLSFDSQNPSLAYLDGFGHGTNMASIIAGSDVAPGTKAKSCATCITASAYSDVTKFVGVAPEARIVNVKAGASDGSVDVSQVIAAIDWVVQHRNDNGMNIRVLNLSYGTDATQSASIDPLSFAVENAWRHGIVVVVSAGNDGVFAAKLANPAYNPSILAVGATETNNTLSLSDDYIPAFAQHGSADRFVDVVAPGSHILGLRVPGSYIDSSVTTGKVGTRFQRGSGTSQAAAVVSGMAALLAQRFPTATPDQIKAHLNANAVKLAKSTSLSPALKSLSDTVLQWYEGNGVANVQSAAKPNAIAPVVAPTAMVAKGTGTLEGARGSSHVAVNGVTLTGEKDIMSSPWDGTRWSADAWAGTSWRGGVWNGTRWSGDAWSGTRWSSGEWSGSDWSGTSWRGTRWSSMTWDGASWRGSGWTGTSWRDAKWSGTRWSTASAS